MLCVRAELHIFVRLYLLPEDLLLLLQSDVVIMLHRDHDSVDSLRDHSSILLLIMYSHLKDGQRGKRWYVREKIPIKKENTPIMIK